MSNDFRLQKQSISGGVKLPTHCHLLHTALDAECQSYYNLDLWHFRHQWWKTCHIVSPVLIFVRQWRKWRSVGKSLGEGLVRWLGRWYVCVLHRGSICSPSRSIDGRIMRHGIISSCQSAATSDVVKRCWYCVCSYKQCYSKYPDLYLYFFYLCFSALFSRLQITEVCLNTDVTYVNKTVISVFKLLFKYFIYRLRVCK